MRLFLMLFVLIISCNKKDITIIPKDSYTLHSKLEHNVINFYKNDLKVDSLKLWNPDNNIFDGIGHITAITPIHQIEISVEFNIYGHINLNEVDSCYDEFVKEYKKRNKKGILPKKIHIIKHHKLALNYGEPMIVAAIDRTKTMFLLSELTMGNNHIFKTSLRDVFKLYFLDNRKKVFKKFKTII